MANEYHDAQGRFCSKSDMQNAIRDLAASGDHEGAQALISDLKSIEEKRAKAKFATEAAATEEGAEETVVLTRQEEIAHARDVDNRVSAAYGAYHEVDRRRAMLLRDARRLEKRLPKASPETRPMRERALKEKLESAESLREEVEKRRKFARDLNNAEYGGWNRFFLVQHIHRSMSCSSFRPSTQVGWLPDVSGLTEEEAVKAHGKGLCTHCFPSAPVELSNPVDSTVCPGSGAPYDDTQKTGREGAYYSPTGRCAACGQVVGLTSRGSGRVRKHKPSSAG